MAIRFALPVQEQTKQAVRFAIQKSGSSYAVIEIWLSCIRDLDMAFVDWLIATHASRLLLVLRPQQGSRAVLSKAVKADILTRAGKASVLIDLDSETEKTELRLMTKHPEWPRIVSHHNMQKTPGNRALERIVKDMENWRPTIYKIATFCNSPEDSVRLLHLLVKIRQQGKRCIILGMGSFGTPTRIFGSLWGNDMIFAPQNRMKQSAPGQLTRLQLETIFNALKGA